VLIVHACSSALIRPNGIVRYINAAIEHQMAQGHTVIFVSDSRPTQDMPLETQLVFKNPKSLYQPNMHANGQHVWLQVDQDVIQDLALALGGIPADRVIVHDVMSYHAAVQAGVDAQRGIFVQHETDVLTPGSRYSYLSDQWLEQHLEVVHSSQWRMGMTVDSDAVQPKNPLPLPIPLVPEPQPMTPGQGLLYVGDASVRKGAREFMDMARVLGVRPTVISHEPSDIFEDADFYCFGLTQRAAMYDIMSRHAVAYMPSRNECPGLAVLECLQFMPVVLDAQYPWTRYHANTGAVLAQGHDLPRTIGLLLENPRRDQRPHLERWADWARQCWDDI
jgi:hypothetical protein